MTALTGGPGLVLQRPVVYRWMAGLFLDPPDAKALAAYGEVAGRTLLDALDGIPGIAEAVGAIRALARPDVDPQTSARALATSHSTVFLIGGPRAAPPYASFWRSERGLLYQEPARRMARLMGAAGLALREGLSDAPDHLSVMLDFMARLLERDVAGEPLPIAPAIFLRDELMTWVPQFAARVNALPASGAYTGLAGGLETFLRADLSTLDFAATHLDGRLSSGTADRCASAQTMLEPME